MTSVRIPVSVARKGPLAAKGMEEACTGSVAAVFRSTFYVEAGTGCYCVGNADLEPSGLNLVTAAPPGTDWAASGVRCGMTVRVGAAAFEVGPVLSFSLAGAATWSPDPLPAGWTRHDLTRGLRIVRDICVSRAPSEGLGRFICPGFEPMDDDMTGVHAKTPIATARLSLRDALRMGNDEAADWNWSHGLIGLGPGLTPSGDDFLGAVMLALHALGRRDLGDSLRADLLPCAPQATNTISLSHLRAASRGYGAAALHDALAAVVTGDESAIIDAATRLGGIGHTSGWDALAGAVCTLDAWAQARLH